MLHSSDIASLLHLLHASPLFHDVESSLLVTQFKSAHKRMLAADEALLIPGQHNDYVYLVLSGRLRVHYNLKIAEPVALLGQCECIGELSILNDGIASAYVIADTDCNLLAIGRSEIWSLIDTSHQAARNMLNIVIRRMHDTSRMLLDKRDQPVPEEG